MKSKNIKRLENYPDILSLEDVRSILDVRTKKRRLAGYRVKGFSTFVSDASTEYQKYTW